MECTSLSEYIMRLKQLNVPHFLKIMRLKQLELKAYVLGGLYLAFLKVLKIKMFRYASGGPYLSFLDYK